jgi:hypothetical protein
MKSEAPSVVAVRRQGGREMLRSALALFVLAACSSDADGASSSSSGGTCSPSLGESTGCPESDAAGAAYDNTKAQCGITDDDLDPAKFTLKADAASKACSSCDCREAIYAYHTLYRSCRSEDQANASFSKSLYNLAAACK